MSNITDWPGTITIPSFILQNKELSAEDKIIFSYLCNRLFPGKKIVLNISYLASLIKLTNAEIEASIDWLEQLGYIKIDNVLDKQLIEVCHSELI